MEISINLLPQSNNHKQKRPVYLIPAAGILAVAVAVSFLTYHYLDTKDSIKTLSENITAQTTARDHLLTEYQTKTTGVNEYNFTGKYQKLVHFLNTIYIDAGTFQERVQRLLPDRAEVISYIYLNNGDLTLTVTVYSKGDAAVFLHRLLDADFVERAELESITADNEDLRYDAVFQLKLHTLAGEKK